MITLKTHTSAVIKYMISLTSPLTKTYLHFLQPLYTH